MYTNMENTDFGRVLGQTCDYEMSYDVAPGLSDFHKHGLKRCVRQRRHGMVHRDMGQS